MSDGVGTSMTSAEHATDHLDVALEHYSVADIEAVQPHAASARTAEWSRLVGPLVIFVLFVAAWHYMHTDGMRRFFDKPGFLLPAPETVLHDSFLKPLARASLLNGLKWTTLVALLGLAMTIVIGVSIAVTMSQAKWVERSTYPYLVALQAIPILSVVPIINSVFGGGINSRLFVCVVISIFPIVTNTLFGLTSADAGQHDLFTLRGASRWTRLVKLQLPSAMPAIFTGFRISAGLSVIGAVVGEQFFRKGSKPGIGIVMEQYRQKNLYAQTYGGLLLAALLGIVVFLVFGRVSKLVVGHWHESSRKPD
ncbi:MAG: ABC transporter permease subunit [Actinobacteria bacterium]|nr:ABC transporter permease subunit [Actinomycetota bacterium]